ncbi:hypothetical protein BSLG_005626 [Batrachochytrium salamandrivorans]|nr:hypothetical protein BSLG_005626 [Batrachochytrium salamandrivorans]
MAVLFLTAYATRTSTPAANTVFGAAQTAWTNGFGFGPHFRFRDTGKDKSPDLVVLREEVKAYWLHTLEKGEFISILNDCDVELLEFIMLMLKVSVLAFAAVCSAQVKNLPAAPAVVSVAPVEYTESAAPVESTESAAPADDTESVTPVEYTESVAPVESTESAPVESVAPVESDIEFVDDSELVDDTESAEPVVSSAAPVESDTAEPAAFATAPAAKLFDDSDLVDDTESAPAESVAPVEPFVDKYDTESDTVAPVHVPASVAKLVDKYDTDTESESDTESDTDFDTAPHTKPSGTREQQDEDAGSSDKDWTKVISNNNQCDQNMADAWDRNAAPSTITVDRIFRTAYLNAIPCMVCLVLCSDHEFLPSVPAHPSHDSYFEAHTRCVNPGQIAITFEGGTDSGNIPKVLDALKSAGAPATFFVNGLNANNMHYDGARNIVRRMYDEGHQVGSGTLCHSRLGRLPFDQMTFEMLNNDWMIQQTIGFSPLYMRIPHGSYTSTLIKHLIEMGYVVVDHNADSGDSGISSAGNPGTQAVIEFDKSISYHSGASPQTHSFITLHNEWVSNGHSGIQAIVQKYRKLDTLLSPLVSAWANLIPKAGIVFATSRNWLEFDAFFACWFLYHYYPRQL